MTMYWRPGLQVLWRSPGTSQIGVDPRVAVVIEHLTPVQQYLLERFPHAGSDRDLYAVSRGLGAGRAPVVTLVERLAGTGVLIESAPAVYVTSDDRYWHLAAVAGYAERPQRRLDRTITVVGLDQIGLRLAMGLAQAGIGRLLLEDDLPVRIEDVGPGAYRSSDVGRLRQRAAFCALRAASPSTALGGPAGIRPDLVVLVEHGVADPVRHRRLMREDLAHLSVLVREVDIMVGPLVRPGDGACLRCLDLHRSDADDRWAAVATQIATVPPSGSESSLGWLGAALAIHQALAAADGRGVLVDGATLEVTATYPLPRYREWAVHPECGCTALVTVETDARANH